MIPASEIEELVRELASEDCYGLYEIIWSLNRLYPSLPEHEKIEAAIPVLRRALETGEVMLFTATWGSKDHEAIARDQALRMVLRVAAWAPPNEESGGAYISFGAP